MLSKSPKSKFIKYLKRGAAAAFVIEAFGFAVCYGGYHRLNTDRDFRLYVKENCPPVLELFYKVGETFGDLNTRQHDQDIWLKTAASALK